MKRNILMILFVAALAGCGNALFYYPDRVERETPQHAGQKYEDVYFTSRDGTRLHGWFVPAMGKTKATILHFHGNAQNISAHYSLVSWLPQEGYNLFTFDYRGYGKSEGEPSRGGIHDDALAAIDYVTGRPDVEPGSVVILGQSLGGAVAIVAASERKQKIRAMIIESTFSSYQDIAQEKARSIPVAGFLLGAVRSLLATSEYDAIDYVPRLSPIPLLLIHGTADRTISFEHSQRLFEKAGEPKQFWALKGGDHIQAFSRFLPLLRPKIVQFVDQSLAAATVAERRSPQPDVAAQKAVPASIVR